MKRTLIAALTLSSAVAHAGVYRCPQTYPGKDAPAIPLTGAFMMWGERASSAPRFPTGWLRGDDRVAQEGIDIRYGLAEPPEPNWLICEYGSRKRIKGRSRDGHEWGQYMEGHGKEAWFMRLAPKDMDCTVQIREIKSRDPSNSTWTATAICKN
jgi:hypothetical protein